MASLALRLSLVIVAVLVPLEAAVGLAAYEHAERRNRALVDQRLGQEALALAGVAGTNDASAATIASTAAYARMASSGFQLWSDRNRLVAASPAFEKLGLDAAPAGFSTVSFDGHRWRVLTRLSDGHWVRVGERRNVEDASIRELAWQLAAFVLLGVPLMLLALRLVLRRSLAPVGLLADEITRCEPGRSGPIGPGTLPRELEPIVGSVNRLLARCARGDRART